MALIAVVPCNDMLDYAPPAAGTPARFRFAGPATAGLEVGREVYFVSVRWRYGRFAAPRQGFLYHAPISLRNPRGHFSS